MWTTRTRSVVIGGGAALLVAAAGTAGGLAAAHAADSAPAPSSTSTAGTPSASPTPGAAGGPSTGRKAAKGDVVARLKGLQHAQWVVAAKDGSFVTHDAIRGTVTSVSATSVTVTAKDGFSATYAVGSSTKVVLRASKSSGAGGATAGKAAGATPGTLSAVTSGAEVLVSGTGSASLHADRIVVPQA